jgi:hypothetical protein
MGGLIPAYFASVHLERQARSKTAMVKVIAKRTVNIPRAQVWRVLSDLSTVQKYHPYIKNVDILSNQVKGIGATRCCSYLDGTSSIEEVMQVANGCIVMRVKDDAASAPLPEFIVKSSAIRIHDSWTEIIFEANYNIQQLGPLGYIIRRRKVEKWIRKRFKKVLEGAEYHLTTGKRVVKEPAR